ncbi:MAG: C25 family cysteine peptidase [Polyangiales bacterium]
MLISRYLHGFDRWYAALLIALLVGCGADSTRGLLVVVDSSLYEPLQASLDQYAQSVQSEGYEVYVEPWNPGTVDDLKALVFDYVDRHHVEGALLIGDLPAAWYEMINQSTSVYDDFPVDLYLQDRDAVWTDEDENGRLDHHSELNLDIYTSRLTGTVEQLEKYFARAKRYREDGPLVDVSAFIFLDDDWSRANTTDTFYLNKLYSSVEVIQTVADSTRDNYLARLTGRGAELVYQAIHGSSLALWFNDLDEQGQKILSNVLLSEIPRYNFKGSFYILSDCRAARFTVPNIAEAYTVGTDYGLAIVGSTKIGQMLNPRVFDKGLALGRGWGEAYKAWYNEEGKRSDEYQLGMVLMGDPLLRLTGDLTPSAGDFPDSTRASPEGLDVLPQEEIMENCSGNSDTFEEYRAAHPEFFGD